LEDIHDCAAVNGEFAISGTLLSYQDVIDGVEGNKKFNYGYYRFADHPYIRKIKVAFKDYYNFKHCLLFTSIETGLFELIRYLSLEDMEEPVRLICIDVNKDFLYCEKNKPFIKNVIHLSVDELDTMQDSNRQDVIVIAGKSLLSLENNNSAIRRLKIPVISLFENPNDTLISMPLALPLADYRMVPLNELSDRVKGGALLSNNDRQMNEMNANFRLRGALLSSRNAACFIHDKDISPKNSSIETDLKHKIANLEDGEDCFLFPSGMNAIATLMDILVHHENNEVIAIGHLYTDTYAMLRHNTYSEYGIQGIFVGIEDIDHLEDYITEKTAAILTESITNPLNDVPDLKFISNIAYKYQIPLIVDNTVATPYNIQPLNLGVTCVVHSTTKYLNGANNHGGGAIVTSNKVISEKIDDYQARVCNHLSIPEMEVLFNNLRDFEERMVRFNDNAKNMAHVLENHPQVKKVHFNFLESHRSYAIAIKLLKGPGSVVSFTLKKDNPEGLQKFYNTPMDHIIKAPSLGSNRTLLCPYTLLAHYNESDKMLADIGLSRYLLRLSVGCETEFQPVVDDLLKALDQV
jgi:cystathionine beta-lyase/cystathionine gamma-synthase